MSTPTSTPSKSVPRRTIVMGAAWSLPVIAAAVAVPAQASSSTPPKKSKSHLIFDGFTADNTIPGASGGITGSVGFKYPPMAKGEIVTANIQVFVNGVLVLNKTYVMAPGDTETGIAFANTKPLVVGKTYEVDFILTGKDASGADVEMVSKAHNVKIKF